MLTFPLQKAIIRVIRPARGENPMSDEAKVKDKHRGYILASDELWNSFRAISALNGQTANKRLKALMKKDISENRELLMHEYEKIHE